MSQTKNVEKIIAAFGKLTEEEQKEAMKKIVPQFCQKAMKDKRFVEEMMPRCMEMMKTSDFPMKDMMGLMSKMFGST